MPDVFTKKKRSAVMSRIRGRGNKSTELRLAALMRTHGIKGWRRHFPVTGKPDFVFKAARVALFVDGCFWHGCPLHYQEPASSVEFWKLKISANQARDRRVSRVLRNLGWRVLRLWEHELRGGLETRAIRRLQRILGQSAPDPSADSATPAVRQRRRSGRLATTQSSAAARRRTTADKLTARD